MWRWWYIIEYKLASISNQFESLTIKKNGADTYNLFGLMWWNFEQNGKPIKSLVSVKSNNLKWDFNFNISDDRDYTYARNGHGCIIGSFLTYLTRKILYNFSFTNVMSNDVLVELTVLNDGKDGFMKYNIYEGLDNYIVKINVAGIKKDEIRVVLEDGIVKVRTKPKNQLFEDIETKLEMFEPTKGEVEIYLPNTERVEAKLEDGILIITAPKVSKGIKIDIQ